MARIERLKVTVYDEIGSRTEAASPVSAGIAPPGFPSDRSGEDVRTVARRYLEQIQQRATPTIARAESFGPPLASSVSPGVESAVAGQVTELRATGTSLVSFEQQMRGVPVFGVRSVIEVDERRDFVSASLNAVDLTARSVDPAVSREEATTWLKQHLELADEIAQPTLEFLPVPDGEPVLTWHFRSVPAAPPEEGDATLPESTTVSGCCSTEERPIGRPDWDHFVSAEACALVYSFSNHHRIDVPAWCRGEDEDGDRAIFYGRALGPGAGYSMDNRFEEIRTFDLEEEPIETSPLPGAPVQGVSNDWGTGNPAAVSAQVNAARVMGFLFEVLRRDSIDDDGMPLESIVHCVSREVPVDERPEWINAVWWRGRMWYGQQRRPDGSFRSLSRWLDIIAHELTHGVTETTANLVYRDLPGALNESMSDIFGVIVRNWYEAPDRDDITTWNWEMGGGLGAGGGPLRDFRTPSAVGVWFRPDGAGGWDRVEGYPDHMDQHVDLPSNYDHGGVHIYSNIHNRAAYNLLASVGGPDDAPVLSPQEVSVLYYLALTRLSRLSDFSDARAELSSVANILYGGSADRNVEVQAAIAEAYDAVGID